MEKTIQPQQVQTVQTTQTVEKKPPLQKEPNTYRIVVPEQVEEKIRYLLRKYPHTEWSGVLFYSHEGTFEDDNLVITCRDLYPMDLGNATFTKFKMSAEVASYMAQNLELFDCDLGLIHSHHTMSTFFSGTDTSTLQEEGDERNCFVSLIVNNAGEYSAAITRKVESKKEVTTKYLGESYQFFGEGEIQLAPGKEETTKEVTSNTIQYFMLDVERHEVSNPLAWLDSRFEEIEKRKAAAESKAWTQVDLSSYKPASKDTFKKEDIMEWSFDDYIHAKRNKEESKQLELFDNDYESIYCSAYDYVPDPSLIDKAVARMVTCSLILNPVKFDLDLWINRHMKDRYTEIFGHPEWMDEAEVTEAFTQWKDFIIDFTLDTFDDPNVPEELLDDIMEHHAIIASYLLDRLEKYSSTNVWMESYCTTLKGYTYE